MWGQWCPAAATARRTSGAVQRPKSLSMEAEVGEVRQSGHAAWLPDSWEAFASALAAE